MIYSPNYLSFYTGKNRKAIFQIFAQMMDSLRRNDIKTFSTFLSDDCIADISMNGHFKGKENVCKAMIWPGPVMDIMRITFSNFVCRSHNNLAVMSAYTQHLYAQEDTQGVYPFAFGGEFNNTFHFINGVWKVTHIRFDLMFEGGNNAYVKDHWRLMDYSVLYGHTPMINPELESPWIMIPNDDEPQSDIEQIFNLEFQNNEGMDGGVFQLSHDIFCDDVFLNYSHHQNRNKNYSGSVDGDYYGRKDAINFFKSKQHKEARLQHNVSMAECIIHGTTARAYMLRSEYHRTKHHVYNRETIHQQPLSAVHEIDAIKINGIWKMKRMAYYPIMEFYTLADECVCFDEHVCGGLHWQEIKQKLNLQ